MTIRGREKIAPDRAVVFVANHLSLVDILVIFRLFTHFKWVSKSENFRVPFIGWNMSLNRYIMMELPPARASSHCSIIFTMLCLLPRTSLM